MSEKLLTQWNETFIAADIDAISIDRAAKILAMVYYLGGSHSAYTFSAKLRADLKYIQKKYGIYGGALPDPKISKLLKKYAGALEEAYNNATMTNEVGLKINWYPRWAIEIAKYYKLPTNNSI